LPASSIFQVVGYRVCSATQEFRPLSNGHAIESGHTVRRAAPNKPVRFLHYLSAFSTQGCFVNHSKQWKWALGAGVFALGMAAGVATAAPPVEAKLLSETRADVLYHNRCSVCHGDRGDGNSRAIKSLNPPPRDLTKVTELPREYLIDVIANGKPGTAMVGFKTRLSAQQIAGLADYIQHQILNRAEIIAKGGISGISGTSAYGALPPKAPAPAAAHQAPVPPIAAPLPERKPITAADRADMSLPFPAGLKGDAAQGRDFYLANCAECHGKAGDGQGPRAYFIRPVPRNFTDERSRVTLNRPAIYAATFFGRNGTEMPAWSKVLSEQEIANVSEFVFQSFIQPGPQTAAKGK